ncbi:TetR/AcrR family transcriptional regulator [Pseudodesulfovibrio pelocollis]|uniref:TetR/AcrR family transcriptional regulator n=1 Tax=Pseudodesulfovibrio pelocollis TaxID=3051432 RepID=UPI00255AF98D|nr:TetR/AcrR family transcriptional regulator [Pseudodesulfovibrio sp. SB368]
MTTAHERKKQPELVRRAILDCAAQICVERGLAALTIQSVADMAGVTKGGVFHHFTSKQALVEAAFSDLLGQMGREIDRFMAADPEAHGRFTRAYLATVFRAEAFASNNVCAALSIAMLTEPGLRALWRQWLADRLERHARTDGTTALTVVRLAADGVWLAELMLPEGERIDDRVALHARLLAMTREPV